MRAVQGHSTNATASGGAEQVDVDPPTHVYLVYSSQGGKIRYLYHATYRGLDGEILTSICANGLRAGGLSGTATRSRVYWSVADFRGLNPYNYSDEDFLKELEKGVPVEIP